MSTNASILGTYRTMVQRRLPQQWARRMSIGIMTVLSGCTTLGVGESEYACQGMPSGVRCMSTRDVYDATNDGQVPDSINAPSASAGAASAPSSTPDQTATQGYQSREMAFVNTYVAPNLPDRPVPIRTPAQVMRIWVAPWEDTNGDLNSTGYLYTEIEPRRWVIGDAAPAETPTLRPLQVTRPAQRSSSSSSSTK